MTKRISITIPDELYEKIQQVKKSKRGSINVSKVCQAAIDEVVELELQNLKNRALNNIKRQEKKLLKLQQQYEKLKKIYEEKGMELDPEFKEMFE